MMLVLCLIPVVKQQFIETYKWDKVKEINIENRSYYFFDDIVDIRNFYSNLLIIDKKSYNEIDIYNIGYIMIKKFDDYENINSVNPLYLIIHFATGHFKEKNGENS